MHSDRILVFKDKMLSELHFIVGAYCYLTETHYVQ